MFLRKIMLIALLFLSLSLVLINYVVEAHFKGKISFHQYSRCSCRRTRSEEVWNLTALSAQKSEITYPSAFISPCYEIFHLRQRNIKLRYTVYK